MQDLVDQGLFELSPMLLEEGSNWGSWSRRVVAIRKELSEGDTPPTESLEVFRAIFMALISFKDARWVPAIAPQLLSLRPRRHNDTAILESFSLWLSMNSGTAAFRDIEFGLESQQHPRIALLTLITLIYLGAFNRLTSGRFTPAYYRYQLDRAPNEGAARFIPVGDLALGTLLLE
ncbi:hypothetical protein B0T25DRAFT_583270 [Lasiosphaeria hispida]|uniref:Uncharacterized protein n=1 Tax=Lasiosphaeria hispida TaxID=260671 RepID=A0AAJ0MAD0_9PEZI|nr:hypothetical protein B0T25DRAFT_583270 [Lasiosphaeria hispida]